MPDFATNPNYIAPVVAPYLGEPTKVAMTEAQRANGFVPGQPFAAEHLNHELNAITARATALEPLLDRTTALEALLNRGRTVEHFDDFTRQEFSSPELSAETRWALLESSPVLTVAGVVGGDSLAHGRARFGNASGSVSEAILVRDPTALPARFDQISQLAIRVKVNSIASGMGLEFGCYSAISQGIGLSSGHGIGWIFSPALTGNWELRSVNGGSATRIDSGIAVSTSNTYILRIDQTSPGVFVGRVDAGSNHTVVATIPAASTACAHMLKMVSPNAGANREFDVDFILARYSIPGRAL